MKTKQKKDLHSKTIQEITTLIKQAKNELFSLQMEKAKNKLKNTQAIFTKRKEIAIMATLLRGKEILAQESKVKE